MLLRYLNIYSKEQKRGKGFRRVLDTQKRSDLMMKGVKKWGWGKKGMIEIPFLIDNRNNIVEYQFPHYVV